MNSSLLAASYPSMIVVIEWNVKHCARHCTDIASLVTMGEGVCCVGKEHIILVAGNISSSKHCLHGEEKWI